MDVLAPAGLAKGVRHRAKGGKIAWLRGVHQVWKWKRAMDDIDIAQRNQEEDIKRALLNRMSKAGRRPMYAMEEGISPLLCEDCDGEIPQARREAVPGCTRCIRCQQEFEEREGK